MKIQRHVGKTKTTGMKVIVVFRHLPQGEGLKPDADNCLVIQTAQLPDMYHDNLIKVVESPEAQQTHSLFELLSARMFADGKQMLQTLHSAGYLRKVPVDDIILHPGPNMTLPLREANNSIDGTNNQAPRASDAINPPNQEDIKVVAQGKLTQAELLEKEAAKFREDAYLLDPSLRPLVGRPADSDEVKATKRVSKNERRRERYKETKVN